MKTFYMHGSYMQRGNLKHFIAVIEAKSKTDAIKRFQEKFDSTTFIDSIHEGVNWER